MALPGTILINSVLQQVGMTDKLIQTYTQKRKNDRTHKMWGSFRNDDIEVLKAALTKRGALNARTTYTYFRGQTVVSGVRFELPDTAPTE